jgi:signal transduction histidine kinase
MNEKAVFGKNVQYSTYPLLDHKNRIAGVISVLRDVTKIREFEKDREEAERLKFLGNLVANFAHEIRNPLNGLSIAVQRIIREFPSENKEQARLMLNVKNEIEVLNRILSDFLSLARPRMKEKHEFDLSSVLSQALDLINEQAKDKNIIIKKNITKKAKLYGNSDDFRRVLINILLNSVEALSNVSDRQRVIEINLAEGEGAVMLVISDNGIGMNQDELSKIFTPYFTTKRGGTGLGLYIAHTILKEHKARIEVLSEAGKGTVFTITLGVI